MKANVKIDVIEFEAETDIEKDLLTSWIEAGDAVWLSWKREGYNRQYLIQDASIKVNGAPIDVKCATLGFANYIDGR
jgi:hypothetical protein